MRKGTVVNIAVKSKLMPNVNRVLISAISIFPDYTSRGNAANTLEDYVLRLMRTCYIHFGSIYLCYHNTEKRDWLVDATGTMNQARG